MNLLQDLRASKESDAAHLNFLKSVPSKLSNINGNVSITFASSDPGLDFAIGH